MALENKESDEGSTLLAAEKSIKTDENHPTLVFVKPRKKEKINTEFID
jgi:hypothetical protein